MVFLSHIEWIFDTGAAIGPFVTLTYTRNVGNRKAERGTEERRIPRKLAPSKRSRPTRTVSRDTYCLLSHPSPIPNQVVRRDVQVEEVDERLVQEPIERSNVVGCLERNSPWVFTNQALQVAGVTVKWVEALISLVM